MSSYRPAHDDAEDTAAYRLDDMDAGSAVDAVRARLSASPNGSHAEPDGTRSATTGTPNALRSSPPTRKRHVTMDIDPLNSFIEDTAAEKYDSEAETIVLPGKDGHSPSKIRKSIKHEDKSDYEDSNMKDATDNNGQGRKIAGVVIERSGNADGHPSEATSATTATMLGKRKRAKHGVTDDHVGNSSGLSSVPTSPVATTRSSLSKPAGSDSEVSKPSSPHRRSHSAVRDKAKSVDRILSRKKRYPSVSEDEGEIASPRFRRQRSSGADRRSSRDAGSRNHIDSDTRRSISPDRRSHKRSISTLSSKPPYGLSHKKKRVPAPLQSTEYHSDESSASGRSHPRSSRIRHLAAPPTGDSAVSPAKMPPHKKHLNPSGQTPLAIAVQRGVLEVVKQRYEERHSDLNLADNAMNTPLHVASLYGFTDIVKFLIDTHNCELDSLNLDKDTPLHDAVDNGHLDVVKLLLDAGANPSQINKAGNEPLDIVNEKTDEDEEEAELIAEMKEAIMAAKRALTTEDHHNHDSDSRMSHPKESPRHTPPVQSTEWQNQRSTSRRIGNVRQMNRTGDTTLYQRLDIEQLREAARDGDARTVTRILEVMPNVNDAQTLYNAARGGHEQVVNFLFAYTKDFDPDPPALEGLALEQATPILAAIGRDHHLEVIKLLLGNPLFDPTRTLKGETYSQIARKRAGPRWQEEEQLFKNAYEDYAKNHKSTGKPLSPGLRRDGRDNGRETKKFARKEDRALSRTHQRSDSASKHMDHEPAKISQQNANSSVRQGREGQQVVKRGPGRPKKEESAAHAVSSDRETTPLAPPKPKSQKRTESDIGITSDHEPTAKPRRKLVSGKEFRGERELERQRRASIASNTSNVSVKENRDRSHTEGKAEKQDGKTSSNMQKASKHQGTPPGERAMTAEKQPVDLDRARPQKRDESKDRLSAIRGESPVKRPRKSETPPRSNLQEVYPQKRRKLDPDTVSYKTDSTPSSSPEFRSSTSKSALSRDNTASKPLTDAKNKTIRSSESVGTSKESQNKPLSDRPLKNSNHAHSSSTELSSKKPDSVSSERTSKPSAEEQVHSMRGEEAQTQLKIRRERKAVETQRQKELEEDKEKEAIKQAHQRELDEKENQRDEMRQARTRERELEEEKVQVEQARASREAREKASREEEDKRQQEDSQRKERQRIEDAEAHQRAVEAQKALYVEQERLKREEADRRRAQQVELQRSERARIEREKREEMLSKLPLLLKWFELENEPKTPQVANLFKKIAGFRYDTIKPEFTGQPAGREQWMLNYHAAILLGEKDLQLSRCKLTDHKLVQRMMLTFCRYCVGTCHPLKCTEARSLEYREWLDSAC